MKNLIVLFLTLFVISCGNNYPYIKEKKITINNKYATATIKIIWEDSVKYYDWLYLKTADSTKPSIDIFAGSTIIKTFYRHSIRVKDGLQPAIVGKSILAVTRYKTVYKLDSIKTITENYLKDFHLFYVGKE